jgi:hypothetical protein
MTNTPSNQSKSDMTTVGGRPTKVLTTLSSSGEILISCRLTTGEDVYVPLNAIFGLMVKEIKSQGGQ